MPEAPDRGASALVRSAVGIADMETVRTLFREYQDFLGENLCFQDFDGELASLPGAYAPPNGGLFLAEIDGAPVGCVGIRPCPYIRTGQPPAAEMKRLYLRPEAQGHGLGRALAEETVKLARAARYETICLDTLSRLTAAVGLYRKMGFVEIPPYYDNPITGVIYMALPLSGPAAP